MEIFLQSLDIIARAGGGGSSSGGGGAVGLIALVGYVPMHAIGAWARRIGIKNPASFVPLGVISGIVALVYAGILIAVFSWFLGGMMAAGALLGVCAGLFGWFDKLKRSKKVEFALTAAANQDHAWQEDKLLAMAKDTFMRYQADWSTNNLESIRTYCTLPYYYHATLLLAALKQLNRANLVEEIRIDEMMVVDMHDAAGTDGDMVIIGIKAKARDRLVDLSSEQNLNVDSSQFTEFWRFIRQGDNWLLDGIQQATEAYWTHNIALENFAKQNGMYYSLDMGRLLVPRRGTIFIPTSLKSADINNHVIGLYAGKYLVQLYTFSAVPMDKTPGVYIVAQMMVPKSYGNIVVQRKGKGGWLTRSISLTTSMPMRGMRKISMEWGDFNKKYNVYATNAEGATSFELLHPAFMVQLESVPFEVNIEVVDNVVYFYANESGRAVPNSYYDDMLKIVYEAYRQMWM